MRDDPLYRPIIYTPFNYLSIILYMLWTYRQWVFIIPQMHLGSVTAFLELIQYHYRCFPINYASGQVHVPLRYLFNHDLVYKCLPGGSHVFIHRMGFKSDQVKGACLFSIAMQYERVFSVTVWWQPRVTLIAFSNLRFNLFVTETWHEPDMTSGDL